MAYRTNKKARKLWSEQANAIQERKRNAEKTPSSIVFIDPYMKITVERKQTNELAVFECFEGDRIDNYRVYCNDKYLGVQSITELTKNIRKALPRFKQFF